MGDVPGFALAEYPIEHSRSTEQPDMPAMKRCEWSPFYISQLRKQYTASLSVGGGFQQQIFHFVQRNSHVGQYHRFGRTNLITHLSNISHRLDIGFCGKHFEVSHAIQ